jgi:hypothetical protein
MAFRDRSLGAPDVVPGEVHMLPAVRGEVSEQLVRNILGLAQSGNGALEVPVFDRMIAVTRRFRPEARCCWLS